MKISIDIDCTPQEARSFLGLPDVAPMQEALMAEIQARMREAVSGADLESLLKTWMPTDLSGLQGGLQGWESLQKSFWAKAMGQSDSQTDKE